MGNPTMNKDYPNQAQRSAICYSQWRKKEVADIKFQFSVPIKVKESEVTESDEKKDFIIEGTAINVTTTSNNHKFLDEELKASAHTLTGVPLLVDHKNEVSAIKGRVLKGSYGDKKVSFKAKVTDKLMQEMISDGRLNSVSVGASVKDFKEDEDDGSYIPIGITFRELSLVAVGADEGATFGVALSEAYNTKITTDTNQKNERVINIETEKDEKKTDEKVAPETVTKEELTATVAKAVSEAIAKEKSDQKRELEAKEKAETEKKAQEEYKLKAKEKEEAELQALKEKMKKEAEEKAAKEAKEKEIVEEDEEDDCEDKYKIVPTAGSLKGSAFTVERRR